MGEAGAPCCWRSPQPQGALSVYYDVLGLFALAYPMWVQQTMNGGLLLVAIACFAAYLCRHDVRTRASLRVTVGPIVRAGLTLLGAFLLAVILAFASGMLVQWASPMAWYTHPLLSAVAVLALVLAGVAAAVTFDTWGRRKTMDSYERTSVPFQAPPPRGARPHSRLHHAPPVDSQIALHVGWLVALLLALAASFAGLGLFYYVFWWAAFSLVGVGLRMRA